jgi:hypothetical protein
MLRVCDQQREFDGLVKAVEWFHAVQHGTTFRVVLPTTWRVDWECSVASLVEVV